MDSFELYPSVPSKESDTRVSSIRETGKAGGNIQYKELDARKQRFPQVELINQRVKAMHRISNEENMKLRVEILRKELQTAKNQSSCSGEHPIICR